MGKQPKRPQDPRWPTRTTLFKDQEEEGYCGSADKGPRGFLSFLLETDYATICRSKLPPLVATKSAVISGWFFVLGVLESNL